MSLLAGGACLALPFGCLPAPTESAGELLLKNGAPFATAVEAEVDGLSRIWELPAGEMHLERFDRCPESLRVIRVTGAAAGGDVVSEPMDALVERNSNFACGDQIQLEVTAEQIILQTTAAP